MTHSTARNLIRCGLVILMACSVLLLFGCLGQSADTDTDTDTDTEATGPDTDVTEETSMDEGEREAEGENGENGESEELLLREPFTPTQEDPLAPPAHPAEGVDNLPPGEVGLAVSMLDVHTGPKALAEGITIHTSDGLLVQFSIVNNTDETIEIVFPTSQKVDILFSDTAGNTIYRWSENRRFLQVLGSITLDADKSWSHELTVPIGSGAYELPEGTYIVNAMVTGTPSMSFTVSGVEIKKG